MTKIDPNHWALYVGDFVDREVAPYVDDLLKGYLEDHKKAHEWPKRTKIQGIYQRSLMVKTKKQSFMNGEEVSGFQQLATAMGETELAEKLGENRPKAKKSKKPGLPEDRSFEGFLFERRLLELRRGQATHCDFYSMVQESLTGSNELAARKAASQLLEDANVPKGTKEEKYWREWTQVYLLHAWVEALCLRFMAVYQEK